MQVDRRAIEPQPPAKGGKDKSRRDNAPAEEHRELCGHNQTLSGLFMGQADWICRND
jgi:hypothetical protein